VNEILRQVDLASKISKACEVPISQCPMADETSANENGPAVLRPCQCTNLVRGPDLSGEKGFCSAVIYGSEVTLWVNRVT
jgi:hypothetical protein